VRAVRSWGTACFVGERGQVTLDVSPDLLRRQVTLVGSWTFSKQGQFRAAVLTRRVRDTRPEANLMERRTAASMNRSKGRSSTTGPRLPVTYVSIPAAHRV
jgi:hypothetical protein